MWECTWTVELSVTLDTCRPFPVLPIVGLRVDHHRVCGLVHARPCAVRLLSSEDMCQLREAWIIANCGTTTAQYLWVASSDRFELSNPLALVHGTLGFALIE